MVQVASRARRLGAGDEETRRRKTGPLRQASSRAAFLILAGIVRDGTRRRYIVGFAVEFVKAPRLLDGLLTFLLTPGPDAAVHLALFGHGTGPGILADASALGRAANLGDLEQPLEFPRGVSVDGADGAFFR